MSDTLDQFLAAITAPTEAGRWMSSPAVVAFCEAGIKEREQEEKQCQKR